ncbi:MAG: YXWGXW repeat-containing protein [Hyphomicrobiales bacterium]|nr:YXWGXW repeat-containing protein [Hyphomicrobiales bacterium]MBV8661866.1 YXWGXW repeat-containing protein [Hyphomicrobiales bacterium]
MLSDQEPPPLPDYDQPPIPSSGSIWTPGYWAWNNYEYYWVPGTWVEPPQPGLLWTPGYWGFADGVYAFHRGYWGRQVGFYGGVNYGYGYGGHGYDGGRWQGDRFFYNRTVNHFGPIHIENVYEGPAAAVRIEVRPSFNGPHGETLRPTREEEAFARDQHFPPTRLQTEHARTASRMPDLFISANHGRPGIAATAQPSAFTGAGVVRANEEVAPLRRANEPAGGEPAVNGERPRPGEAPRGAPSIPEPQLPPAVEGPHEGPAGAERERHEAPRPAELEHRPTPGAEAPRPDEKLPPGLERERREAPGQTGAAPREEHRQAPSAAAPAPDSKLPPGLERERREAPSAPGAAPNAERQRAPGGSAPAPDTRMPPGAERQHNDAERRGPPPGPGPQAEPGRPRPQPGQPGPGAQSEHRKPEAGEHGRACGQPGQPNCP